MHTEFSPNWYSVPGETISEILSERNISIRSFSTSIHKSEHFVNCLINGDEKITSEIAHQLSDVLGASVDFWLNRQIQYDSDLAKYKEEKWVSSFPIRDMVKLGWMDSVAKNQNKADVLLEYFGVPSMESWNANYSSLIKDTMFRRTASDSSTISSITAWLRQGEVEAEKLDCKPWNPKLFRANLNLAKELTRQKDPSLFVPKLTNLFAESGVALVIVRAPVGIGVSGATRFLAPDRAVMQLSFRYLSEDQFWFTVFHEAGHLLLHGDDIILEVDVEYCEDFEKEEQADQFAGSVLVPKEFEAAVNKVSLVDKSIIRLAREMGISAGILVGQLQFRGRLEYRQKNYLKRRYTW